MYLSIGFGFQPDLISGRTEAVDGIGPWALTFIVVSFDASLEM